MIIYFNSRHAILGDRILLLVLLQVLVEHHSPLSHMSFDKVVTLPDLERQS